MDKEIGDCPDDDGSRQFCQRWLEAWSGTDFHAVVDLMCEDAAYRDPVRPMGIRGKQAIADYLELLFVRNPDWKFTLIDVWKIEANTIVMKRRVRNTVGDRVFEDVGVEFIEFKDGLVWYVEIYYDRVGWKQTD